MAKVNIIYWSGTGNTETMANLISEGAKEAGAEVSVKEVSQASADDLNADVLALGCPSMGDEVLEESEFEPYMESIEGQLSGKKVALFGSYGWGDGEWMRDWHQRVEAAGAMVMDEGLIVEYEPEGESAEACKEFGKSIAAF
ncbi:MAG: flavodoxin [Christensenellales bacterium]|jgi:flavodoxin I